MAEQIGLDPDIVAAGGQELQRVAALVKQLMDEFDWTSRAFDYSGGGTDMFVEILDEQFRPAEEWLRNFLQALSGLLNGFGLSVGDLKNIMSKAGDFAADIASYGRR